MKYKDIIIKLIPIGVLILIWIFPINTIIRICISALIVLDLQKQYFKFSNSSEDDDEEK